MREIEFRAFYKGKIRKVNFLDFKHGNMDVDIDGIATTTGMQCVMQYTGLKDKNGVKIFEGDIIEFEGDNEYGVVKYENGAFGYELHWGTVQYFPYLSERLYHDGEELDYIQFPVIGNIYENLELLE